MEARQILSREIIEAFIAKYDDTPEISSNGHSNGHTPIAWVHESFTLESFMQKHDIRYKSKGPYNGGTRYKLEACVWDSSHTDNSACLYDMPDGLGASCSHNSCKGKHWKDFRVVFERDAYTQKEHKAEKKQAAKEPTPIRELPAWKIEHQGVMNALICGDKQAIYALAPVIAEMDTIEQDRIRLAAFDVWRNEFPMREFISLLRSAKEDNERKRLGDPDPISAYDLMRKVFPPIDYVVPDILPTGLIVLAGKQKIGKSWLDLNLALAVASGGVALGHYQVKQGDVLYLALEDTERRLQDRIGQLLGPGSEAPRGLHIETKWPRMDIKGITKLEEWIIAHPNTRLIMVDPWVKVKPRMKNRNGETGYDTDYEALEGIKHLADKYSICILIQFHLRKANAEDPFDEINATTGVTACADGLISIKRARGTSDATLYANGRDYKEEVNLALAFDNGFWKVLGDGQAAIYYTLSEERKTVIDLLCGSITPQGEANPLMPKEIASLLDINDGTVRKMLFKMKEDSQVTWVSEDKEQGVRGGYISLIPSPKQQQQANNKNAKYGNGGNGGSTGNYSNGGNSETLPDSEGDNFAQSVTENDERYREGYTSGNGPQSTPEAAGDSTERGSVTAVTTVTSSKGNSNSESEPIPLPLLQEYRDVYQELQKVDPEKIAPMGTLQWYVPGSDLPTGQVSKKEYSIRLQALYKSDDIHKVQIGLEEMQRKLAQVKL